MRSPINYRAKSRTQTAPWTPFSGWRLAHPLLVFFWAYWPGEFGSVGHFLVGITSTKTKALLCTWALPGPRDICPTQNFGT